MVCCRVGPFLSLLSLAIIFLLSSYQVRCNGDEDALIKSLNTYRESQKLPKLIINHKASCVADEIAEDLKYHNWNGTEEFSTCDPTGTVARLVNFPKVIAKCNVDPNATVKAVVLPVYMPKLNQTLLLTNYTRSPSYAEFVNASRFSGVGVGIKDTWTALILTVNDTSGNFSYSLAVSPVVAHHGLLAFVLGLWVALLVQ